MNACEGILSQLQDETVLNQFIPELEKLASDPVPNVRLSLSKLLQVFSSNGMFFHMFEYEYLTANFSSRNDLRNIVNNLVDDKDKDVSFFAKQVTFMQTSEPQENETHQQTIHKSQPTNNDSADQLQENSDHETTAPSVGNSESQSE